MSILPKTITIMINAHGSEYNSPYHELKTKLGRDYRYSDSKYTNETDIENILDNVRILSLAGKNGLLAIGDPVTCSEKTDVESYIESAHRFFADETEPMLSTYEILQELAQDYLPIYETTLIRQEEADDYYTRAVASFREGQSLQVIGSTYDKKYSFNDTENVFKLFGVHVVNIRNYPEIEDVLSVVKIGVDEEVDPSINIIDKEKMERLLTFIGPSNKNHYKAEDILKRIAIDLTHETLQQITRGKTEIIERPIEKNIFLSQIIFLFNLLGFEIINIIDLSCRSNNFNEEIEGIISSSKVDRLDRENATRHNRAYGKKTKRHKKTKRQKRQKCLFCFSK
jgi:hypothetical protein